MFGLASLQMAQSLRTHVKNVRLGGPGLSIPDSSSSISTSPTLSPSTTTSSTVSTYGSSSSKNSSKYNQNNQNNLKESQSQSLVEGAPSTGKRLSEAVHTFSWRDFFDIFVRWRQVMLIILKTCNMRCFVDFPIISLLPSSLYSIILTLSPFHTYTHTTPSLYFYLSLTHTSTAPTLSLSHTHYSLCHSYSHTHAPLPLSFQISEPNDPVWWIDRLPAKAFAEGTCSTYSTLLLSIRYIFSTPHKIMPISSFSS